MKVQYPHILYILIHIEKIKLEKKDKMLHINIYCITRLTSIDKESQMQVCTVGKPNQSE